MNELLGAVHDLQQLGIGKPELLYRIEKISAATQGCYRDDFYELLSTSFAAAPCTQTPEKNMQLQTKFGNTLLEIIRSKHAKRQSNILSCSAAEGKLQESLLMTTDLLASTKSRKGPLMLLRNNGTVVAVQKNIDVPSIYALASVSELGLVAHTFSAAIRPIRPRIIKTEEPALFIEASAYEGFSPLRVAATAFSSDTLAKVAFVGGLGAAASTSWSYQQIKETVDTLTEQCTIEFSDDMLTIV